MTGVFPYLEKIVCEFGEDYVFAPESAMRDAVSISGSAFEEKCIAHFQRDVVEIRLSQIVRKFFENPRMVEEFGCAELQIRDYISDPFECGAPGVSDASGLQHLPNGGDPKVTYIAHYRRQRRFPAYYLTPEMLKPTLMIEAAEIV